MKQKLLDRQRHDTTPPEDKMPSRTADKEVIEPKSDELIFFFRFSRHKLSKITTEHRSAVRHTFRLKVKNYSLFKVKFEAAKDFINKRKLFWNDNFLSSKIKFETTVKQN